MYYNGENRYLFVNGTKIIKLKAKDFEISGNTNPLCFGNISRDFSIDNMKKIGLNGYIFDFSVNYDTLKIDDILDIHKYLMANGTYRYVEWLKTCKCKCRIDPSGCKMEDRNDDKCRCESKILIAKGICDKRLI